MQWGSAQANIPVVHGHRDLGAYFNIAARRQVGTLTQRFENGTLDANRIARLPRTVAAVDRMLGAKALAKALYGTEVTEPRVQDVRALSSACASALTGKCQTQRNPLIATAVAGNGRCEVRTAILMKRWYLMRRAWHTRPKWQAQIRENLA